ncbi:MAG: type I methionyl aminopeptidase [Dehalococcoidales bacterium]|nr:type I methionyl aminopeptidase [Dehalococcoidales bacterium]
MTIEVKSNEEIVVMRESNRIVAEVLRILVKHIEPGMKTKEMDIIAEQELKKRGAESSFKGYRGYPATICVSINDQIVHGIPGNRVFKEGDIVSLDFGAKYKGFHGDAALTVPVGKVTPEAQRLLDTTRESLEVGIAAAKAGGRLGDISAAIEAYAESKGYSLVREYTGHGIGRKMHEEPQIPNSTQPPYGLPAGTGPVLKKGMTIALEPMLNIGDWHTKVAEDQWTVLTADGSLSAHFEHTIVIDDDHAEVLTKGTYD